ncbi:hypothetical protein P3F01_15870 [Clostridium perfringens]|uniref:hypothetical protein n=1 Tax=Clostridium perfringens TaxID=1502 RepID=UPI0028E158A3|nr:hypothetical protein [Clostridium perfringens]MDT9337837.1 hypothetical protein [Clostridium perfringens]MDT9345594.1 hypothetical protein [Clostridium perfringens]MDT9346996.1 hypothetical protein [Clostridium perfringens]MDT9354680.1 hypothetical protein [Clostridium perfringens]
MEEKLSKEEELFIKRFQEHIEADQEEVKHALNINRQQRKQYIRKKEKELRAVKNLTPIQIGIITKLLNKEKERMDISIEETRMSTYSCINAALTELYNLKNEELIKIWDETNNLLEEDIKARRGLGELSKEEMDKLDKNVKTRVGELIYEGKKQKEIIETLKKEFPKLSAAMRTNVYKEVKEEVEEFKKMKDKEIEAVKKEAINTKEINSVEEENKSLELEKVTEEKIIKMNKEGIEIKVQSIAEQLKGKLVIKTQEVEKETEELKKLESLIADKKEKINKIQEDIARIEEASAILEPVNI